jgi:hypothetical protein
VASEKRDVAEYRARVDELGILELATGVSDDELGNVTYEFDSPGIHASLMHNKYDGDTSVVLSIPGRENPIARIYLVDCAGIRAVNDKRGKYLEFIGQLLVGPHERGGTKYAGFRLYVEPEISLEPFFNSDA